MGMRRLAPALGVILALAFASGCRKENAPAPQAEGPAPGKISPAAAVKGVLALTLPCGKDSSVSLYDDTSADDADYVRHRRMDSVFSDSGYFVSRGFYEGGDWLYVSKRDCAQLGLFGRAIFNPARTRFASVNADLAAGFEANGVQIVSLESGTPEVKLEDSIRDWAPESGAWKDDSTFVAELADMDGRRSRRTYALRAGVWAADTSAQAAASADSLPYPEERSGTD